MRMAWITIQDNEKRGKSRIQCWMSCWTSTGRNGKERGLIRKRVSDTQQVKLSNCHQ